MEQTVSSTQAVSSEHGHGKLALLGPILCWAVVFADIGTSIYYVPGILYGTVQTLAGFFVTLTLLVFVLLSMKYVEITHRFAEGGGVVTTAGQSFGPWLGALGGMFILVDYFLTASISSLSGMQYLSVVIPILGVITHIPGVGAIQLPMIIVTILILIGLGVLNWIGISESAKWSLIGALIAFFSDIAILITVFSHISFGDFIVLLPKMFENSHLTPVSFLVGFAASFLAFSGLESISQLSPVMKQPHKKVGGLAMLIVVVTIGLTSPLLTILSTMLQESQAQDPVLSAQLISLLGGHYGGLWGTVLQTEIAISASCLLVFASNTAIIGAYHVFLALSRMEFLPAFLLRRNKSRNTPHFAIALATGIPIVILIAVKGEISLLGDLYAFGLLGAFVLSCSGIDLIRYRERKIAKLFALRSVYGKNYLTKNEESYIFKFWGKCDPETVSQLKRVRVRQLHKQLTLEDRFFLIGSSINYVLGFVTTAAVALAWGVNLPTKLLATAFGGIVTIVGMFIAYDCRKSRKLYSFTQKAKVSFVSGHQRMVLLFTQSIVAYAEKIVPSDVWSDLIRSRFGIQKPESISQIAHLVAKPGSSAVLETVRELEQLWTSLQISDEEKKQLNGSELASYSQRMARFDLLLEALWLLQGYPDEIVRQVLVLIASQDHRISHLPRELKRTLMMRSFLSAQVLIPLVRKHLQDLHGTFDIKKRLL